ncbi:MAG: M14 family zinc carboxypeptidase, partial [Planctomycetia bacterium]
MIFQRHLKTIFTLFLVGLLLGSGVCLGQAKKTPVYQAMGAPSDPKVDARWNRYHDHASITRIFKELAKTFPEYAKLSSLGKSYGGREMWVLTITNFSKGKPAEKPGFFVGGGIHANELQCSDAALYIAWYLLEMHARNPQIAELVDNRTFYVMPAMSPDSRDSHLHEPNSVKTPRSGMRPVDDDRDGLVNEDGPDDLDGDGNITQMRVRDPHGNMKPHPEFPNLLIPCKKGEKGSYRLLGTEGYDNDQDGRINEDRPGSYD